MKEKTDQELFLLIKNKKQEALEELYDRYINLLYSFVFRMTQDEFLTKEILQKVFLRLWMTQSKYNPEKGKFSSWLLIITRNITIDVLRKERKHQQITIRQTRVEEQIYSERPFHSPETIALKNLTSEELKQSLTILSEEQRHIIELSYWKGFTLSETANILKIPLGTVKSRLHQSLKQLRYYYQEKELKSTKAGRRKRNEPK